MPLGMVGGLGLVPASGPALPPVGYEYVLSEGPQGKAVLRPLRYPFYDTEKFEDGQQALRKLFSDHKKFNDGSAKTIVDTNMTADGEIGHPNLFDLVGFTGELEWGVNQEDFNDFYQKSQFVWFFGANTIFTNIVLKKVPQGLGPYGFNSVGTIMTNGLPTSRERYDFTTPDRKARRIDSTEKFRNEIQLAEALSITATGRKWTTYMVGIYYSQI